jgi:hypothetical protein
MCRYAYMYYVGGKDLYEATQALAYEITRVSLSSPRDEPSNMNRA